MLSEQNAERLAKLEILDSVAWAHDRLLPKLEIGSKVSSATVHPTCATRHMGLAPRLRAVATALADDVYFAPSSTCCGFAGDRGISHPELTAAATRPQAEELAGRHFDAHLSNNRTCEIGLEPRHRRGLRVGRHPARALDPGMSIDGKGDRHSH